MYQRPYSIREIQKIYPKIAEKLIKEPIHKWRAEMRVELVHKEPTRKELERIWANWQEMNKKQKALSDEKSMALFGMNNEEHY